MAKIETRKETPGGDQKSERSIREDVLEFKFECASCGKCCEDLKNSFTQGFEVYPWEMYKLGELARNRGLEILFVPAMLFRLELGSRPPIYVTTHYILNHVQCPFLNSTKKCSIYEDRPLLCQSFPFLQKAGLLTGEVWLDNKYHEIRIGHLLNRPTEEVMPELYRYYGANYLSALKIELLDVFLRNVVNSLGGQVAWFHGMIDQGKPGWGDLYSILKGTNQDPYFIPIINRILAMTFEEIYNILVSQILPTHALDMRKFLNKKA